jgi:hypothetical protein
MIVKAPAVLGICDTPIKHPLADHLGENSDYE